MTGFLITGEFITQHARQRLQDLGWREAVEFLQSTVVGITYEQAIELLKGEQQLVGQEGRGEQSIELVADTEESRQQMQAVFASLWAGVVREGREYWRPYAFVRSFDYKDVNSGERLRSRRYGEYYRAGYSGSDARINWAKSRCVYYMNSPATDRVEVGEVAGRDTMVLFEQVEPPLLGQPCEQPTEKGWAAAVAAFAARVGPLEERGASPGTYSDSTDYDPGDDDDELFEGGLEIQSSREFLKDAITGAGAEEAAAEGLLAQLLDPPKEDELLTRADVTDSKYGYILPNGHFYACTYYGHRQLAESLFRKLHPGAANEEDVNFGKRADEQGWLTLSRSADGVQSATIFRTPSERQQAAFEEWRLAHRFSGELSVYR